MTVDQHAEELASDLGVNKEEVERDLRNLLTYSVPVDEAKQSLRRKYGAGSSGSGASQPVAVTEITPSHDNVSVSARILTLGKRSILYEGDQQVIYEGELADEHGKISYTAWEDFGFDAGDTVQIQNASVREWNGNPELNLGASTIITNLAEEIEVPYSIGGETTLDGVSVGDRGNTVEVVIKQVDRKTVDGRTGETEILSGVLGDETARLPFTDWDPHNEIEPEATLRLEDVYIREFRGVPSVNISEFTTILRLDSAIEVAPPSRVSIRNAVESGGAFDIEVIGNVVGIRDGSGLIQRCPECGRVIRKGQCRSHGEVDGIEDLRTKAILDDGTGSVTAILDDKLTSQIYGGGVDEAREAARNAMDHAVVTNAIRAQIVGREYLARGNLSVDEYGANLNATAFNRVTEDPIERANHLLEGYSDE